MTRRQTKNVTGIKRISGISAHDAWVGYVCVKCAFRNIIQIGDSLLPAGKAFEEDEWKCERCGFVHSRKSGLPTKGLDNKPLPFAGWDKSLVLPGSLAAERFWRAFFRIAVGNKDHYWKQCGTCGRIQPSFAFDRHGGWGPLEKQMECRSCKAVINTKLNPLRTAQQLYESSRRRRIAELLLEGEGEEVDIKDLFKRFDSKCFKTGVPLNIKNRKSWEIDHILPSTYLYPLSRENAALLSQGANGNKRDKWPSDFYTNEELIKLAKIVGADLSLLSSKSPKVNLKIDVNKCVGRLLTTRSATDLSKRIEDIKTLLKDRNLVDQLSKKNKKLLGY